MGLYMGQDCFSVKSGTSSGVDPTIEPLSVIENGTYTAPSGKAYTPVTVNVPTGTSRSASDLTVSGATVNVPAGLYGQAVSKTIPSGTAGTPAATKGAVSNHSIQITPSVTNTTGYITGGTKNGTPITVTASELVSGSETKTVNGTYDVTNLKTMVVDVNTGSDITVESLNVTANGTYTAPSGKAYTPVSVAVPVKEEQSKSATYNQNGTYTISPDSGKTLSGATITVNVSGGGGADVYEAINRSTNVNVADTNLSTVMARGISAGVEAMAIGDLLTAGTIYIQYA